MEKKITIKNIKSFLEGNSNMLLDKIGFQPAHIKEQVAYRIMMCESCMLNGKCEVCGCDVPGKLYVKESCNKGVKFPDLMSRQEWDVFKKENGIDGV